MKKLTYLFAMLIMIMAIVSCSKESTNDNELDLLKKATAITQPKANLPTSDGGTTPYLIPGANPGGNRTCAEVETAWKLDPNPFFCGEKIDYSYGAFAGEFPSGLSVTTDGKYVSFEMEDCILIGDKYYKVGAVIIKGSNNANVYYYPDGTTGDSGLASPLNNSGNPAGLSNLTFCFVECQWEWVITFKSQMTYPELEMQVGVSGGTDSEITLINIGYNPIIRGETNVYPLLHNLVQIGTITVTDFWKEVAGENIHYLKVVVDTYSNDWMFAHSYLYVGSLDGFKAYRTLGLDGLYKVAYIDFPFEQGGTVGQRIFEIPFSSITE